MFAANAETTSPHDLVAASQRLRHAVHHQGGATHLFDSLGAIEESVLATLQDDQDAATAFWLNLHGTLVERARHGEGDYCRIAGVRLEASEIKHGILRSGRWRHGFGYLPALFPGLFERRHRLADLDPRIHFATLAARHATGQSVTFTAANVDGELRGVTAQYLAETVEYDRGTGVASVPRVFFWYRGDFGGKSGVRSLLVEHDVVPAGVSPRLSYGAPEPRSGVDDPAERAHEETQ